MGITHYYRRHIDRLFSDVPGDAWLYVRYQFITKLIFGVLLVPLFAVSAKYLLGTTGRQVVSSGDYLPVIFSPQGALLGLIGLIFMVLLFTVDINSVIVMEAYFHETGRRLNARQALTTGIRTIRRFAHPSVILLVVYAALVVPLTGMGITVGPLANFKIPNFITDVIYKNPLYMTGYVLVLVLLAVLAFLCIFTFQFMVLTGRNPWKAMGASMQLVRRHWKRLIVSLILMSLTVSLLVAVAVVLVAGVASVPFLFTQMDETMGRWMLLTVLLVAAAIVGAVALLATPFVVRNFTRLFYAFTADDGDQVHAIGRHVSISKKLEESPASKAHPKTMLSILAIATILGCFGIGLVGALTFDTIFADADVKIVAHRAGGDLAAENSIAGITQAADHKIAYSEIDIQRTKDGRYIVNHDPTFERVAGDPRSSMDVTADEATQIKIHDAFDPSRPDQPVGTLEEALDAAKGRLTLFIELKGSTADEQMIDDAVRIINEKGMKDEVVLLSLDYKIVTAIEEKYPEFTSGYLYYFSAGDIRDLTGDYLVMEEGAATPSTIDQVHRQGKKAIVWTVNTPESMHTFLGSKADAVITDHPLAVQEAKDARAKRTDVEIVMDAIFG